MKAVKKNLNKLSKQLTKSVKSHAESATTLDEESKRIAKASKMHSKQVKTLKKLRDKTASYTNLTKLANRVNPLNMMKQQYMNDLGKELNPINAKMTALQKQVHARMNKEHTGAKPLTDFDRDRMLFDESNPRFAKERNNYLALQKQMQAAHQNVTKRYNIFK